MPMMLYSAALLLGLVLSAPWWLLRLATTQRYREGLRERLGSVGSALRQVAVGRRVVWVHAVSVGEVLAASRLVAELEAALATHVSESRRGAPKEWLVVISTTTRTGQALARERFGAERVFYMPLDFAWAVRRYLRALRPELLVLMESEVWPRLLHECRGASVPVAVVNARVSDRSFARGMRVRGLWGRVLRGVSLWLAQSDDDARRLIAMGARAEMVRAIGNLKFDVRAATESKVARWIEEVAAGRPIVVAGSACGFDDGNDEEIQLTFAWEQLVRKHIFSLLVLAPRHPERFTFAESIAREFVYAKASEPAAHKIATPLIAKSAMNGPPREAVVEFILLDTIGDLAAVYGVADVAFVGGSLVNRGGHNPLEPAQFGVPVVMGPHFENFRTIVAAMQAQDGIRIVADAEELEQALTDLLSDRARAEAMGRRGQQVFEQQQGATVRAVVALTQLMQGERP